LAAALTRLSDAELLALVLTRARGRAGLVRAERVFVARRLEEWARLAPETCIEEAVRFLARDAGPDARADAEAQVVAAVFELGRRALGPAPGLELSRADEVVPLLHEWRTARREHFVGFYLNARNQLLARVMISIGSLSASIVHPREVFQPAIEAGAAGLIVAHNHPSGDPEPSPEDIAVTRRLADAGELLGIELLDHLIVAERGHVSLKARGHL
jgi:DNA repair protein RadC